MGTATFKLDLVAGVHEVHEQNSHPSSNYNTSFTRWITGDIIPDVILMEGQVRLCFTESFVNNSAA